LFECISWGEYVPQEPTPHRAVRGEMTAAATPGVLEGSERRLAWIGRQSMTHYIGLDIHKNTISFCIREADGTVQREGCIPATRQALDG